MSACMPSFDLPLPTVTELLLRYAKKASFFNGRYTTGVTFLSKIVYKRGNGLDLGAVASF